MMNAGYNDILLYISYSYACFNALTLYMMLRIKLPMSRV